MKQVKKTTRIFLVLTLSILFSCSSDDSDSPDINPLATEIIGDWGLTKTVENGEEEIEDSDCFNMMTITATDYDFTERFDFGDGNGCVLVGETESPEPYTLNGSILSVTDDGESSELEIIELNSTTLILRDVFIDGGETITQDQTFNRL